MEDGGINEFENLYSTLVLELYIFQLFGPPCHSLVSTPFLHSF